MATRLVTSHTLFRVGGRWKERPIEEESLPPSVVEAADQVQGAQRGVTWVLGRGRVHDVPDDIAAELRKAGVVRHGEMRRPNGLHGVLQELPDPVAPTPRVTPPAMSAEAAAIAELRQIVEEQAQQIAQLAAKRTRS